MNRVHQSLDQLFLRHRLVFWYDQKGEWAADFDTYAGGAVAKLAVDGDEFGTKVRIHRDGEGRFLLYFADRRPEATENWLLDLLLQGHEFKADRVSLVLQEVGIDYGLRHVVQEHMGFFRSQKRQQQLRDALNGGEGARELRLKMMAVQAKCSADVDDLLLTFLAMPVEGHLLDPVEETLGEAGLTEPFWREVSATFGYASPTPGLRDFAVTLFRWDDPLDGQVRLDPHARVFLNRWKDSQRHAAAFREWATRLEDELRVEQRLEGLEDVGRVQEADTFPIFERFVLSRLCLGFAEMPADALRSTIRVREASHWYGEHRDGYQALAAAVELRELLGGAELQVETAEAGFARYAASWYRIDTAYRTVCLHARRYGQVAVLSPVVGWVEKAYVNNFLLPLADRWSDRVRSLPRWEVDGATPQSKFFTHFVLPFLDRGQRMVVIVSDALRYEAAADLAERLEAQNRWTAELSPVLASLPSYTQLGMASLLPGNALSLEPSDMSVAIDGRPSAGTAARGQILAAAMEGRGTAVQAEKLLEMNTKLELRQLLQENNLLYVFHDTIDRVGDDAKSEGQTPGAVDEALRELSDILHKLANANATNMLVTADHGFLFQQSEVVQQDDLPLPSAKEWIAKNRRYALGRGIDADRAVEIFEANDLGLSGDWSAAFPLSLGRFPLSGSGKRYVHGGVSLQEVVVPVLKVRKARSDDTEQVEVDLLRVPAKITTGSVSLALYQDRPVAEKTLPRRLSVGVYAPDGTVLSELRTVAFDSSSEEPRTRETAVNLVLSKAADDYSNKEVEIRLVEQLVGTAQSTIYKAHRVKLQKRFVSDFDDF